VIAPLLCFWKLRPVQTAYSDLVLQPGSDKYIILYVDLPQVLELGRIENLNERYGRKGHF